MFSEGIYNRACKFAPFICVTFVLASWIRIYLTLTHYQMVNVGRAEGMHWPDNWTSTTVDGRRSAQFEETLL